MIAFESQLRAFKGDKEVIIGFCPTPGEIRAFVDNIIEERIGSLPRDARILIKPNFHKDLPSILSNTTDFRLIIAVVRALQRRGYKNIRLGEGPACGFEYLQIDVFRRLHVPELAQYLGVGYEDFNKAESLELHLAGGRVALIAKSVRNNDYFINLPKLKTHLLAQLSAALKSLVGCFVGLQKRRMHDNLIENIILVNEIIRPDLTFVDALVAMEGQGPGIGTPVVLDRILCGANSFTIDLACAIVSGHNPEELALLRRSVESGHLTRAEIEEARQKIPCAHVFQKAIPKTAVRVLSIPALNRLREIARPLFLLPFVREILYRLEIREDRICGDDGNARVDWAEFPSDNDRIRCMKYCPLSADSENFRWPEDAREKCLNCFYCVFLSAEGSARLAGEPGYLEYLMAHYRPWTTKLN